MAGNNKGIEPQIYTLASNTDVLRTSIPIGHSVKGLQALI